MVERLSAPFASKTTTYPGYYYASGGSSASSSRHSLPGYPTRSATPTTPSYPAKRPRAYTGVHTYDRRAGPWDAHTEEYVWVVEEDEVTARPRPPTERWVKEQQAAFVARRATLPRAQGRAPREDTIFEYESDADHWATREDRLRWTAAAAQREAQRLRAVEADVQRIQSRIRERRESEGGRMMAEARRQAQQALRERALRDRERAEMSMVSAWARYEERWAVLVSSEEPLTFGNIPWPMEGTPYISADIDPAPIAFFLFSLLHSHAISRKDRLRAQLLRWHPDRFQRLLARVVDTDKAAVEEGVGIVARCLNDLMGRESNNSR